MPFELVVVSNTPLTPHTDFDQVTVTLLKQVGYLDRGANDEETIKKGVAYRLVRDCFLLRPEKAWTADELLASLDTTRPTLYRHLNKLKALDILEETALDAARNAPDARQGADEPRGSSNDATGRKAYRIRYGNVAKAWNFVEANVKIAMENYRKSVDHLHALAERAAKETPRGRAKEVRA